MKWWRFRRGLSDWLELNPEWYLATQRLRYRNRQSMRKRIESARTDIVIEGFPRSANSFAVKAFRYANDPEKKLWIATHLHSPAPIITASRRTTPTLVLIRDPDQAVISQAALFIQTATLPRLFGQTGRVSEREKRWLVAYWTRRYCQFYERLMSVKRNVVVAEFGEVTSNFSDVIHKINVKYDTAFKKLDDQRAAAETIFRQSGIHLSPSAEREEIKSQFSTYYFADDNKSLRNAAQAIYRRFSK